MSAPSAYALLGVLGLPSEAKAQGRVSVREQIEQIRTLADSLTKLVASEEMLQVIDEAAKKTDKNQAAADILKTALNKNLLQKTGLDAPLMRVSLRVFEKDATQQFQLTRGLARTAGTFQNLKVPWDPTQGARISDSTMNMDAERAGGDSREQWSKAANAPEPVAKGICASYGKDFCVSAGIP